MKKLLLATTILAMSGAHAFDMQDFFKNLDNSVALNQIKANPDGSVTISDISVTRGDSTMKIVAQNAEDARVCRLLGFENIMSDQTKIRYSISTDDKEPMAFLRRDGSFYSSIMDNDYIEEVTCYDGKLKQVFEYNQNINADGSVAITDIKYLRGSKTLEVSNGSGFLGLCKALGYERYLMGPGLNTVQSSIATDDKREMVIINYYGLFDQTEINHDTINKVTCINGADPELGVLVGGNRYRRTK